MRKVAGTTRSAVREAVCAQKEGGDPKQDQRQQGADKPGGAALLPRRWMGDAEDVDEGACEKPEGIHGVLQLVPFDARGPGPDAGSGLPGIVTLSFVQTLSAHLRLR